MYVYVQIVIQSTHLDLQIMKHAYYFGCDWLENYRYFVSIDNFMYLLLARP